MKHAYFLGLALASLGALPRAGGAQTVTVAQQDFETTPATPTLSLTPSGGSYRTGTSGTGDKPTSSPLYTSGSRAYGANNGTATLTGATVDARGYGSLTLEFRLASFSLNSLANGADAADLVTLAVSLDGGLSYQDQLTVKGNSNSRWSYASGTGLASRAYSSSAATVFTSTSGDATTGGYGTVRVTGIPATSSLRFRLTLTNDDANELWAVDDLLLTGTGPGLSAGSISGSPFCVGAGGGSITVPFTVGNGSFNSGNTFTAYLSADNFVSKTALNPAQAGTGSGSISGTLPAGLSAGTAYRVRVEASSPALAGVDNGSNLTVVNYQSNEVSGYVAAAGNGQVTLSWTNPGSCWQKVLIVAKAGSTLSASPSTAASYTASAGFGAGTELPAGSGQYVVYQGAGSTATITGLTNNTQYAFRLFTTNGDGYSNGLLRTATPSNAATLTEVLLPRYLVGHAVGATTHSDRLPYAFRATLSGLTANATYSYYNSAIDANAARSGGADAATYTGVGTPIFPSASGFTRVSSPGLSNSGTLTTDASGSYTGWFVLEPTGNDRFEDGDQVQMRIILNNGAGGTSAVHFLTTTSTVSVRQLGSGSTQATGLYGTSLATDRNFVFLYDNASGSGRPLAGTFVESDGTANTVANNYASFYATNVEGSAGRWGTLIPNDNLSGVRRVEQRSLSDGQLSGCVATSADGSWGSGAGTALPGAGGVALALTSFDAPLSCTTLVGFSPSTKTAREGNSGSSTATLTVTVPNAPVGADLLVTVSDAGTGTATAGTDFLFSTQTLTFAAGSSYPQSQTVTVTVLGDAVSESNETVVLSLATSGVPATVLAGTATLTIIDDDNYPAAGLIVNEFSQGPSGAKEYVELLVTGTPGATVDLRGWTVDDNNGDFSGGSASGTGVTAGHLRFKDHCTWAQVPVGSLIVLYNAGDRNAKFSGTATPTTGQLADDPTDANLDYVYVLPILDSGSCDFLTAGAADYAEGSCTLPSTSSVSYGATTGAAKWTTVSFTNGGDAVQVRSAPTSSGGQPAFFHGVSYGTATGSPAAGQQLSEATHPDYATLGSDALYLSASGAATGYYFDNTTGDGNFRRKANWASSSGSSLNETPGAANSPGNATYLDGLRQVLPVSTTSQSASCGVRAQETRVFVAADNSLLLRLQNLSAVNDLGTTTATVVPGSGGALRSTGQPGRPFYLPKQYQVTPSASRTISGADSYTVTFFVTDAELTAFTADVNAALNGSRPVAYLRSRLKVYKTDGATLVADLPGGAGRDSATTSIVTDAYGTGVTSYSATFSSFGAPSSFALGGASTADGLLPLSLTSFTARRQGGGVALRWTTASELPQAHFAVQRATPGQPFQTIVELPGRGANSQPQTYVATDNQQLQGELYYRLRHVDAAGEVSFSPVVVVPAINGATTLFPNPAHATLTIPGAAGQPVRVVDLTGRQVAAANLPANAELSVGRLPAGLYLLVVGEGPAARRLRFTKE